jgi:hypothetical protein
MGATAGLSSGKPIITREERLEQAGLDSEDLDLLRYVIDVATHDTGSYRHSHSLTLVDRAVDRGLVEQMPSREGGHSSMIEGKIRVTDQGYGLLRQAVDAAFPG